MGAGKGLAAALNCHMRDEHKEVRDGITGEGQELSEEDESRINEAAGDVNDGSRGADALVVHQASLQMQQQQAIVRWDRFLPLRTLNVLLVEIDDSTRQVVSALLRNCSYEVIAAANGLQAWKILEDLTNRIDLVLTEVVMPCLSGVGLLCNIMNHKSRKDIPVIMMSSNDSMGIVFKCLSKGAVDFLVKPIRKNELRNLWQHVWRRCHISSCSGSASGVQTKKLAKSRSADDSDNNTGSNDEDANDSIGLNTSDGSDNGSETQSSWTKHAVEIDSPRPMSPSAQLCGPHDSTCAQAIHPDIEPFCNGWMSMTTNMKCQEQNAIADLEIGVPRNLGAQHDSSPTGKVSTKLARKSNDKLPKNDLKNEGLLGSEGSNAYDKLHSQAADLVGDGFAKVSEGKDLPSLELNLKRQRSTAEGRAAATQDDRNFLRRSNISAFSRYHASAQAPTEYAGSCSPLGNSSEAAVKTDTTQNMTYNSNAVPLDQGSNGSCDNNDMGSTTNMPAIHTSAFHPVVQHRTPPQATQEKIADVAGVLHQVQVQHIYHYYHRHHPHVHNMPPDLKDVAFNSRAPAAEGGVVNTEGDNAGVERNENGSASGSGVDQNWLSQREAALHKFRQKRKERNFQKKVRYQSRKRLAEQRPRVRGQFVRQATDEPTSWEADS